MKKYLFSLLSIFLAATLCVSFISCGDSKEDDESYYKSQLIGAWTHSNHTVIFRPDGTCESIIEDIDRKTQTSLSFHYIYDYGAGSIYLTDDRTMDTTSTKVEFSNENTLLLYLFEDPLIYTKKL